MGLVGHVTHLGGNIPLGRPRHMWKDDIKMEFKEIKKGRDGVVWAGELL